MVADLPFATLNFVTAYIACIPYVASWNIFKWLELSLCQKVRQKDVTNFWTIGSIFLKSEVFANTSRFCLCVKHYKVRCHLELTSGCIYKADPIFLSPPWSWVGCCRGDPVPLGLVLKPSQEKGHHSLLSISVTVMSECITAHQITFGSCFPAETMACSGNVRCRSSNKTHIIQRRSLKVWKK